MEKETMQVTYSIDGHSSIYGIKDLNSSFSTGTLDVMYTGKNRNKSCFSRESVEDALPSIKYVPIVCHYDFDSNEIGGHDSELVIDKDNSYHLKNLTEPIGVVPHDATGRFEIKKDANGVEHEYLVIEPVILWKRQEAYAHIVEDLDGVVDHSMEIKVKDGHMNEETGYFDVDKFEFTALCLLEAVKPCFEGSQLTVFSADEFRNKFELMMEELKEIPSIKIPEEEFDISNTLEEGGKEDLKDVTELNQQEATEVFEAEATEPAEEVEAKFEEAEVPQEEPAEEPVEAEASEEAEEPEVAEEGEENFELNSNISGSVYDAMAEERVETPWGIECRYWCMDYDNESMTVYARDSLDGHLYGFKYTMNGDSVSIDYTSKKRMKYAIVEFDDGEFVDAFAEMYNAMAEKTKLIRESADDFSAKFESASATITELNAKIEELEKFKADAEFAAAHAEKEEVVSAFSDLAGIEAYDAVIENMDSYSVEELENKCYEIRGRFGVVSAFSATGRAPRIPVMHEESGKDSRVPYGGVVEKYTGRR